MILKATTPEIDRQLPEGEQIFLDHVGHFVRDPVSASGALARAGFAPTPASVQVNPDGESPTGTGNVTAMFRHGYIETLFKTAETPLGRELDQAIARYPGVHLVAFSVSDAGAAHRRLESAGFAVRPLVHMQRPVATLAGPDIAAFTVARVQPGAMAEGRIQILTHHTEQTVWQPRWLDHPNGALGLIDVVIATSDVAEAAGRFSRFLDRPASSNHWGAGLALDRGHVQFAAPEKLTQLIPDLAIPAMPFIGVYAIAVTSLDVVEHQMRNDPASTRRGDCVIARFPDELGVGAWVFVEEAASLPWRAG
jgi:hypothetical protein